MTHDQRDDGPLDLSALRAGRLDAAGSPARWTALVARIDAAAAPELARRAGRRTTAWLVEGIASAVARFTAPALVAAAAAILIAVSASRQADAAAVDVVATRTLSEETVEQALLLGSASGSSWIAQQRAPSADDLVPAMYDRDPE